MSKGTIYSKQLYIQRTETDEIGFLNKTGSILRDNDVLLVGDSFSTISDPNLASAIEKKCGMNVFNLSFPGNRLEGYFEIRKRYNIKPKIIIFEIVERSIINYGKESDVTTRDEYKERILACGNRILSNESFSVLARYTDLLFKDDYKVTIRSSFNKALGNKITELPTTTGHDNILFYNKSFRFKDIDENDIDRVVDKLLRIQAELNKDNIRLVFVPVPDKETVYFDYLPADIKIKLKNRDFLFKLYRKLEAADVHHVDLLSPFLKEFNCGNRMYLYDDTHWNSVGIELASDLIVANLSRQTQKTLER